jgi:hypothetical protein
MGYLSDCFIRYHTFYSFLRTLETVTEAHSDFYAVPAAGFRMSSHSAAFIPIGFWQKHVLFLHLLRQ